MKKKKKNEKKKKKDSGWLVRGRSWQSCPGETFSSSFQSKDSQPAKCFKRSHQAQSIFPSDLLLLRCTWACVCSKRRFVKRWLLVVCSQWGGETGSQVPRSPLQQRRELRRRRDRPSSSQQRVPCALSQRPRQRTAQLCEVRSLLIVIHLGPAGGYAGPPNDSRCTLSGPQGKPERCASRGDCTSDHRLALSVARCESQSQRHRPWAGSMRVFLAVASKCPVASLRTRLS